MNTGWTTVTDKKGHRWAIDWPGISQTLRAYYGARYIAQNMRVKPVSDQIGFLQDVYYQNFDVSWPLVRSQTQSAVQRNLAEWSHPQSLNLEDVYRDLLQMRAKTRQLQAANNRFISGVVKQNSDSLNGTIQRLDTQIEVLKTVRDVSASTLVIGAGFVAAPAGVAILGAGSVLTGTGHYQDTGNAGAAVVDAVGTFVLGSLDLRGVKSGISAMTKSQKLMFYWAAKMPVSALFSISTDLLDGDKLPEATLSFASKELAGYGLDKAGGALLKSLPLPVQKKIRYLPFNYRIPLRGALDVSKDKAFDSGKKYVLQASDSRNAKPTVVTTVHSLPNQPADDDATYVKTLALHPL